MLNQKDIEVLRSLAVRYAEIASLPIHKEKERLWTKLNDMKMERPMICIDQMPWHELDIDGSLVNAVEDSYWRNAEKGLRQIIYKWEHLPADMVVPPYITLPRPISNSGYGMSIKENRLITDPANDITAHYYLNQIENMDDVQKIKTPVVSLDREKEAEIREQAQILFDGIIPYKMTGQTLHIGIRTIPAFCTP